MKLRDVAYEIDDSVVKLDEASKSITKLLHKIKQDILTADEEIIDELEYVNRILQDIV